MPTVYMPFYLLVTYPCYAGLFIASTPAIPGLYAGLFIADTPPVINAVLFTARPQSARPKVAPRRPGRVSLPSVYFHTGLPTGRWLNPPRLIICTISLYMIISQLFQDLSPL